MKLLAYVEIWAVRKHKKEEVLLIVVEDSLLLVSISINSLIGSDFLIGRASFVAQTLCNGPARR